MAELFAKIACGMPRELASKGIGWQDRAVYTEAIYYGRENLRDGVIRRGELPFWMPDMAVKERARRLNALQASGALLDHPEGWAFPEHVWRRWGLTKSEVEDKRLADAERKAKYREEKRREKEASEDVPAGQRVAGTDRDAQQEQEVDEEQEVEVDEEVENVLPFVNSRLPRTHADGRALKVAEVYAAHEWARANQSAIGNYAGFMRSMRDKALDHVDLPRYLDGFPDAPADVIAAALLGQTQSLTIYARPPAEVEEVFG